MVADRGAAGGDQHVGAAGLVGGLGDGAGLVRGDADLHWFRTPAVHRGGQGDAVGADDLIGAGDGAGRHQLVAGGEDRHPRPAADRNLAMAGGGQKPDVAGGQGAAGGNQRLADAEIHARAADEAAGRRDLAQDHLLAHLLRVLLQRDDVGALGDHGAGEDADALARTERPGEPRPGARDADLAQAQRHVADVGGA